MYPVVFEYKPFQGYRTPLVPFAIKHADEWFRVQAYVDSGAYYSIFSDRVADYLRLDYRKGQQRYMKVGDGSFILTYRHTMEVQLGKNRFKMPVAFSEQLGVRVNLLGREGIFNRFRVCFDERNFLTTFTPFDEI